MHITRSDGLAGSSIAELSTQRLLVESLGGSYHSIMGEDIPAAVLDFARANNATQIVIGASRRNPVVAALTGPGTGMSITRTSGTIDVHVVSHDYVGKGRALPRISGGLTRTRRLAGLLAGALLLTALVPVCAALRTDLPLASDMLLFLLAVVIVSLVGGFYPAFIAAVAASLLINFYFVPPFHTLDHLHARQRSGADRVRRHRLAGVARGRSRRPADDGSGALQRRSRDVVHARRQPAARRTAPCRRCSQRVQETFAMSSVTLLRRENQAPASAGSATRTETGAGLRGTWSCIGSIGADPCLRPEDGDAEVAVGEGLTLVLRGRALAAGDQRLLAAFAGQLAVAYEQRRLAEAAQAAAPLAEADQMRTAILNALSHDLRTPLASAKIAVSSLRGRDVVWTEADQQELLANADAALDQLTTLVTDLLDLSRVEAGVLAATTTELALDDVIAHALDYAAQTADVVVDVPAGLPEVLADAGLLDRVIANLVENAVRYSPPGRPVRLAASAHGGMVELRIVDRGPGIPEVEREGVFAPFQRRDDHPAHDGAGVGLGLAIARAFTRAMHGTISLEDTPGGGLTAVVSLPAAPDPPAVAAAAAGREPAEAEA